MGDVIGGNGEFSGEIYAEGSLAGVTIGQPVDLAGLKAEQPLTSHKPDGSENAASATGRWVAAITALCAAGRSAAKASWNFAGSIASSTRLAPSGPG